MEGDRGNEGEGEGHRGVERMRGREIVWERETEREGCEGGREGGRGWR